MQTQTTRSAARARHYKPAAERPLRTHRSGSDATQLPSGQNIATDANTSHQGAFGRRMAVQAIVCGGFLALMLLFNLVDTAPTNAVTDWVAYNIAHDMLAEIDEDSWFGGVLDFFSGSTSGGEAEALPAAAYTPVGETDAVIPVPNEITPAEPANPNVSRIDENILREIMDTVDVYYENNR